VKNRALLCGAAIASLAGFSRAAIFQTVSPYTDTQGDSLGSTNGGRDIVGATIGNDATNLFISFELNPTTTTNASGTETPANVATSGFNYGIGITSGPGSGGDTSSNATTHGNAYGRTISIDSTLGGMTDWIGVFGAGGSGTTGSPFTSYGFNDFVFGTPNNIVDPAGVWTKKNTVASGQPMSSAGGDASFNVISITVPLADFADNLSLTPGTTIYFDIYPTGGSGNQTAYDSLADQSPTQNPATFSATAQYNGTVLDSYTVQSVPEPTMLALLSVGGLMLIKRRSRA
jgi:hypothetical protein